MANIREVLWFDPKKFYDWLDEPLETWDRNTFSMFPMLSLNVLPWYRSLNATRQQRPAVGCERSSLRWPLAYIVGSLMLFVCSYAKPGVKAMWPTGNKKKWQRQGGVLWTEKNNRPKDKQTERHWEIWKGGRSDEERISEDRYNVL